MADDTSRIAAFEQRLAALAAENRALRARLDETRATLDLTMRGQGRCRACGGRSIIHATEIVDGGQGSYSVMGVALKSAWTGTKRGKMEAYICAGCGLMEWYVKDPSELESGGKSLRRLDPPPDDQGGPYR